MLSHDGLQSHVIGAFVTEDYIELLYYDHSIIIVPERLYFLDDPSTFTTVVRTIPNLSAKQWGYESGYARAFLNESMPEKYIRRFELQVEQWHSSRAGSHGFPTAFSHRSRNLCLFSRAVIILMEQAAHHKAEFAFGNRYDQKGSHSCKHDWVLRHLPKVLHAEEVDTNVLSPALIMRMGGNYEERVLRVTVLEELFPIAQQATAPDLVKSICDVFNCKLMLRKEGDKVHGILIDFDLAVEEDVNGSSMQRTSGTKPFMAIDLLLIRRRICTVMIWSQCSMFSSG
jgi:hypothetical protein